MSTRLTPFWLVALTLALGLFICPPVRADNGLVVHEWGTFTTLQDEQGRELSGINIDDEPVPPFVHDLNPSLLASPVLTSTHWEYRSKGAPRHHPLVTMRLETPVIYFYPPKDQREPFPIDVSVKFRGGWLTQFYPVATYSNPQLEERGIFDFGNLTPQTTSTLTWSDLRIGTGAAGPETEDRVWLAPRKVNAVNVTSNEGESEKYLFYRGVGNLHAPLRISMDRPAHKIQIQGNFGEVLSDKSTAKIPPLWLVDVRKDGTSAFRHIDGFTVSADQKEVLAKADCKFAASEFSKDNRQRLEQEMQAALVADGLYPDEATALLSTWQWSYFESPGLRVFYIVPRVWTDHYLPLSISGSPQTERVMVGRIELISDEQRQLLARLAQSPIGNGAWVEKISKSPAFDRFIAGRSDFGNLGVEIPQEYQLYLQMGRFRNALVTAEEARKPSPSLTKFIDTYGLHPFRVAKATAVPYR